MANSRTIHATIEGKVQGVFFRDSTRKTATGLNITGWVKNLPDGRVGLTATGEPQAIDQLLKWLNQGPPLARVDKLDWQEQEIQPFTHFEIH